MSARENFALFPLFPLSPLFLSQYLLDATDVLVEKCSEKYVVDPEVFQTLCFLVVTYRTCDLDEDQAIMCLNLIGVPPASISDTFAQLAEYYDIEFPEKLIDKVDTLHSLLPDVPPYLGCEQ